MMFFIQQFLAKHVANIAILRADNSSQYQLNSQTGSHHCKPSGSLRTIKADIDWD